MLRQSNQPVSMLLEINGLSFCIETWGTQRGRPILLLHGFPQAPTVWEPIAQALAADGFRVFAPWQRGYGPEPIRHISIDYTFDQFTADALAIADALELQTFDVAGFGLGSAQAWMVAAYHAKRVRSLTALRFPHPAAFARGVLFEPEQRKKWRKLEAQFGPTDLAERATMLLAHEGVELRRFLSNVGLPSSLLDGYVSRLQNPGALLGALSWERAVDLDLFTDVPPVCIPTLYVWSEGPALSYETVNATRNYVLAPYEEVFIEGAGNFLLETVPQELIKPMRRHLQKA